MAPFEFRWLIFDGERKLQYRYMINNPPAEQGIWSKWIEVPDVFV